MKRIKFDDAAHQALTDCVRKIEATSDAELVLIVRARSGNYRHSDYLFGVLLAFAGLLFLLFAPFDFQHYWVAIDVALLFALGAWISARSNQLRRLLTRATFRAEAVRTSAAAMFYEAGIANTSAEMGVLIYLSILERRLELIADRGVLKCVNALEWNQALFELHLAGHKPEPQNLQAALENLGAVLAKHVPCTGENPNELPDAPRFELK
ncbi:MAG: putative rane protein [Pyrinomonadaceae bacterium]|jgi:putative membrane protein|nr:putative rane protein [Pyrinomonadaceae bacterium]